MDLAMICFLCIGAFIGFMFTMFLINFDGRWKVLLETIFSLGGSGGSIFALCNFFDITQQNQKFSATIGYVLGFFLCVIISLAVMCKVIKDKDDNDILRIRDILLGQKSYIETYYGKRQKEIDEKLGIKLLEKREKDIAEKEYKLKELEKYICEEKEKIELLGKSKLRLELPEKANIVLTKDYITVMPSYIGDIFRCISSMNEYTKLFLSEIKDKDSFDMTKLRSFFFSIATYISSEIFGGQTNDVRIHFRYYDKQKKGYCKLIAIIGNKIVLKDLTIIPYKDDNMIKKSYECRRALIKSINIDHDYVSNNHSIWKDYMTYTFYNLLTDQIPYLSFGISVKNVERYKKNFHFINFFMLESYLQDYIEQLDECVNIEKIIYGGES